MSLLSRLIDKTIDDAIRQKIPEILDHQIPVAIERIISDRFITRPNDRLSEVGFAWATAVALRKHWPEVSINEAARLMREYIDVPYGTDGYIWTLSAAADLARQYVTDFGERS